MQQQQYQPDVPPAAETKTKRRIPRVAKVIGIIVLLIAVSVTAAVVLLYSAGKMDYFKFGNDKIPSVKLALGEERKLVGASSSAAIGGGSLKVFTYQVSGSAQNTDMVNYLMYLREKDGFLLLTGFDFNGPEGTCVVGRNSIDDGYQLQVQIEYDRSGYIITILKQKGEITPNVPENGGNQTTEPNQGNTQQSRRTPAETVLLYANLCNALDYNGLKDVLYDNLDSLDSEGYTFVSIKITVQNPSAQMEPFEIEYYQKEIDGLLDTAIVCAEVTFVYKVQETKENWEYVKYLDYYLISTESHPDWMIITWTNQAGYNQDNNQTTSPSNNSQTSNPSGNTGSLTKDIFELLNGGTYHMKMMFVEDGEESVTETYADNGMTATVLSYDGIDMRIVVRDGKSYTIMDEYETVHVTDADPDPEIDIIFGDPDYMTYIGEGSGDFHGKTYKYDEYIDEIGDRMLFYVDGGALKGICVISGDGTTEMMEILALDKNILDSVFDIPSDYLAFGD